MNLDFDLERFRHLLQQAEEQVLSLYGSLPSRRVTHASGPGLIAAKFAGSLPQDGQDPEKVIREFIPFIFDHSTLNISPNFFAYVMSGGSQIGIIAELFTAALNVNHTKWHIASAAAEIERTVIRWLSEFVGYRTNAGGVLVSGGSEANLYCLRIARDAKDHGVRESGCWSRRPLTLYGSAESHSCITKSIEMLGMGSRYFRKIPVGADFRIDLHHLEKQILQDIDDGFEPFCLVGNAGTVNSGAVDDLEGLANLADKYQLWFHIDGAYGASAAQVDLAQDLFRGIESADSIALDPHKWLQVPFEAGCALIRDWQTMRDSFDYSASYLQAETDSEEKWDWMKYTFQLSRCFRALKVWMQFEVYGSLKLKAVIADNIRLMRHLGGEISRSTDFELIAPVSLSIVCFRYVSNSEHCNGEADLDRLNTQILEESEKQGSFFLTGTKLNGHTVLRACLVNHRTTEVETSALIKHIRSLGEKIAGAKAEIERDIYLGAGI